MKKRIYKLKECKAVKAILSLSLAFALVLSVASPVSANADEIIPNYDDLVADSYAWLHLYVASKSANNGDSEFANKHLLFVWDKELEYGSEIYIDSYHWQNTSSPSKQFYEFDVNCFDKADSQATVYDVVNNSRRVYMLSSVDGTGVWNSVSFKDGWAGSSVRVCHYSDGHSPTVVACSPQYAVIEQVFNTNKYRDDGLSSIKTTNVLHEPVVSYGNATEGQWNGFLDVTKDFIGYHYLTENGTTLWKELRFNHVVYPYWEQGEDGIRKLMIYAPYEQTIYMIKDFGRYVDDGIYDYYVATIELTDEWCIQPYAWYTDYQPDTSVPEKVFEVIVLPYIKDGYGAEANAERTLRTVYSSKSEAMNAYLLDNPPPTEEPTPTIIPEPTMPPLEPSDDDNMGMLNFIKEWEALFNASGNFWKIMQYTFLYVPYELIAPITSILSITLALIVIRMVT